MGSDGEAGRRWMRRRRGRCAAVWSAAAFVALAASPLLLVAAGSRPPRVPLHRLPSDLGLPFETVAFASRDGLRLGGWLVPCSRPRAILILCHGHPANRCETLWLADLMHRRGFACFLFDFRAMGVSEGAFSSVGALETADLLGAVDLVSGRPEFRGLPVVAYGMSMGGAVCLRVAAGDARVRGVATYGAYATLADAVDSRARSWLGPAGPLVARLAMDVGGRWTSADLRHAGPLVGMERLAPRPVLLLHGALDRTVPPSEAWRLQAAARRTCDVVVLPHSTHAWIAPPDRALAVSSLIALFERSVAAGAGL